MDAILVIGFDGRWRAGNEGVAQHTRKGSRELVGRAVADTHPRTMRSPAFDCLCRCMVERVSLSFEHEHVYADGSVALFAMSLEPVPEGALVRFARLDRAAVLRVGQFPLDCECLDGWYFDRSPHGWRLVDLRGTWLRSRRN